MNRKLARTEKTRLDRGDTGDAAPRRSMVVPKSGKEFPNADLLSPHGRLDAAKLTYRLLHPQTASGVERWHLTAAYQCWDRVWSETLRELDNASRVFSDDFTRQDELGSLFHEETCVGLTCFRWVDINLEHNQNDSYFKPWPASALRSLAIEGPRVCIGSNLTVLPEWRGSSPGFSVKGVLMGFAVERFLASDADAMTGTMRNDRGMNGLVYELGASPLMRNVVHHGVMVDLVVFSRRALLAPSGRGEVDALTREIWKRANSVPSKAMKAFGGNNHENRAR